MKTGSLASLQVCIDFVCFVCEKVSQTGVGGYDRLTKWAFSFVEDNRRLVANKPQRNKLIKQVIYFLAFDRFIGYHLPS